MKRAACLLVMVLGCGPYRTTEYGDQKIERGRVSQLVFVPKGHGDALAPGYSFGSGGGMTLTDVSIDIPARYAVVFECAHGTFAIQGHKAMWQRLKEGVEVDIKYREVIEVVGDQRTVVDLDFLDAHEVTK